MKLFSVLLGILVFLPLSASAQQFEGFNKKLKVLNASYIDGSPNSFVRGYSTKDKKTADKLTFRCDFVEMGRHSYYRHALEVESADKKDVAVYSFKNNSACDNAAEIARKYPLELLVDEATKKILVVRKWNPAPKVEKALTPVQVHEPASVTPAEHGRHGGSCDNPEQETCE